MEKYKIKIEEEKIVIRDKLKGENIKFIALKGDKGDDGYTPVKGVDYFTEEDIESLNIPSKTSDLDNDNNYITNSVNDLTNYTLTSNLSTVATSGSYNDLSNKPTIPTVPTDVSAFTNDVGYINSIPSEYITDTELGNAINTPRYDCPYIVGTQEEATNKWTGVAPFSSLEVGQEIRYYLPVAGTSSAATLNLTLSDGTTTGEISILRAATSTVTTNFAAGNIIYLTYDGSAWKVSAYVDSNTNTIGYQLRTNSGIYKNGAATACTRYQLLVEGVDGLEAFTSTSNSTKATKTQLSPQYIINGRIKYYSSTTTIASESNFGVSAIWQQYAIDLRYSFNITTTTLTVGKPVYIKMSVNDNGTLSPVYSAVSGGHPLVQDLPTTEDNYVYVRLGQAYSGYQMELEIDHPMYEFKNNKLRIYGG